MKGNLWQKFSTRRLQRYTGGKDNVLPITHLEEPSKVQIPQIKYPSPQVSSVGRKDEKAERKGTVDADLATVSIRYHSEYLQDDCNHHLKS
jgi:pyruvate/2-oxoglutarate dehydrogenase complex dihydrolipoamide dehydrogenase (E3) component